VRITPVVDADVRSCLPGNHDWYDIRLRFVFIVIILEFLKFERQQRNLHAQHHGDGHFIVCHRLNQHDADDRLMLILHFNQISTPFRFCARTAKLLVFVVLLPLAAVILVSSGALAIQSCKVEGHSGQVELVSDSI
jgi:hypothetical protein